MDTHVEFDETSFKSKNIVDQSETSGMAKKLIELGIVKDKKQADYLLLILAVVAIIVAVVIFLIKGTGSQRSPTEQDIQHMIQHA
jgi:hypothetical protein